MQYLHTLLYSILRVVPCRRRAFSSAASALNPSRNRTLYRNYSLHQTRWRSRKSRMKSWKGRWIRLFWASRKKGITVERMVSRSWMLNRSRRTGIVSLSLEFVCFFTNCCTFGNVFSQLWTTSLNRVAWIGRKFQGGAYFCSWLHLHLAFHSDMPGDIFNPNPIVFRSSTKSSASSRQLLAAKKSLWMNEPSERSQGEEMDEDNEEELIDQDEIFGTRFLRLLRYNSN